MSNSKPTSTNRSAGRALLVVLILAIACVAPARADLDAGKRAYDAGEFVTALRELTPLAEGGNAEAQVLLGLMYLRGDGVPKDAGVALKWYMAAAEQGNAEGQANLGSMYLMGKGVPRDVSRALKLWKLSANQGNAGAQVSLGLVYRNSRVLPHDFVQSYMWFDLAALGGDSLAARQRDDLRRLMSPDQIRKAQTLAREWKPTGGARASSPGN